MTLPPLPTCPRAAFLASLGHSRMPGRWTRHAALVATNQQDPAADALIAQQDWYGVEDAAWIDPMAQVYLAQFPAITRVQHVEE